jgi:hypothetical protein
VAVVVALRTRWAHFEVHHLGQPRDRRRHLPGDDVAVGLRQAAARRFRHGGRNALAGLRERAARGVGLGQRAQHRHDPFDDDRRQHDAAAHAFAQVGDGLPAPVGHLGQALQVPLVVLGGREVREARRIGEHVQRVARQVRDGQQVIRKARRGDRVLQVVAQHVVGDRVRLVELAEVDALQCRQHATVPGQLAAPLRRHDAHRQAGRLPRCRHAQHAGVERLGIEQHVEVALGQRAHRTAGGGLGGDDAAGGRGERPEKAEEQAATADRQRRRHVASLARVGRAG